MNSVQIFEIPLGVGGFSAGRSFLRGVGTEEPAGALLHAADDEYHVVNHMTDNVDFETD